MKLDSRGDLITVKTVEGLKYVVKILISNNLFIFVDITDMKNISISLLFVLFSINTVLSEDKIESSHTLQFGSRLELRPQEVAFERDGRKYKVNLPFEVNKEVAAKLLKLVDTTKVFSLDIHDDEVEKLYIKHVTDGREEHRREGQQKWLKLSEKDKEEFLEKVVSNMKEYYAPVESLSFQDVMAMLIKNSDSSSNNGKCECIDLNGIKIKSCDNK